MPDKMVALLTRFLEQNKGLVSKRAIEKEFPILSNKETLKIEEEFMKIFFED
jgi:hypothetical protein